MRGRALSTLAASDVWQAKRAGLSDSRLALLTGLPRRPFDGTATPWASRRCSRRSTRARASSRRARPIFSTYEEETEVEPASRPRIVILGAGPNRIGQGIEFDYACVHAAYALEEAGFESVMVNSNPETVSTDYDTSSRLYFEPLARTCWPCAVPSGPSG